MNGNMHGMHKTVLPSAVGCQAASTKPPPPPLNYAPTFSFPMATMDCDSLLLTVPGVLDPRPGPTGEPTILPPSQEPP